MGHTKGKLDYRAANIGGGKVGYYDLTINRAQIGDLIPNKYTKEFGLKPVTIQQTKANAARIVKCWNSHDELLEALKRYTENAQNILPFAETPYFELAHEINNQALQAIKNAE